MTPVELSRTVLSAVRRAVDDGELRVAVPERAVVTVPGPGGCGDYATNIALQLARPAGQPPRQVAEILKARLAESDGVHDVVVTGPGFLNISLSDAAPTALVAEILRRGPRHGFAERPTGQLVQLHSPYEIRAVVVMETVGRLLGSQGVLVRTSCESRPEPEWETALGVHVDAYGRPGAPAPLDVNVRPVPAPADPLSLGRDAARWALLHPAAHDRPRITDEHLVQRETNPLFRVRYAHARTRALLRNAADLGFAPEPGPLDPEPGPLDPEPGPPNHEPAGPRAQEQHQAGQADRAAHGRGHHAHPPNHEPAGPGAQERPPQADHALQTGHRPHPHPQNPAHPLLTALADHPRVLAQAAAHRAPDRLTRHLVTVADAVLSLLPVVLPRGGEKPSAAHRARLALAEAAGAVLAGGLSLLGIDAPDHL